MRRDDLYFMLNPALGIIKIGIAGDVEARRVTLEHGCGVPLDVLRVVRGGGGYETDLHDAFGPSRLRGEWFAPTDELFELATGTADVEAFIRSKREMILEYRAACEEAKARRIAAQREASQKERDAAERLAAKEKAIREKRVAKALRAKEREAEKRREQQSADRERAKIEMQNRLAAETGLPVADAMRIAKDRREAVAQRFRNSSLLGLRRPEVIASLDLKRSARQ